MVVAFVAVPAGQQRDVSLIAFGVSRSGTLREEIAVDIGAEAKGISVLHRSIKKVFRVHGSQFLERVCADGSPKLRAVLLAIRQRLSVQRSAKKCAALADRAVDQGL